MIPAFQSLQDPVLFLLWFLIGSNEDELSQEKFVCQFCTKDLSHFNSARKTQHLNRCMDKVGIACNTKIEKLISADLKKVKMVIFKISADLIFASLIFASQGFKLQSTLLL